MIRIKIGQKWKREPGGAAMDSLSLELDGMDLLTGASEERLAQAVPELVAAVHSISVEGRPLTEVSLPEARLELCLWRHEQEVRISVVNLSRPARLTRAPVTVDLRELSLATARSGRAWAADLRVALQPLTRTPKHRRMLRQLSALERSAASNLSPPSVHTGFSYRRFATRAIDFGFELLDPDDLLLALGRDQSGALGSLLCAGSASLRVESREVWQANGSPFLLALELSRQAPELAEALDRKDATFVFQPAGTARRVTIDVATQGLSLHAAICTFGLDLAFAVSTRNPAQARNPYLEELVTRCREGLSALRQVEPPSPGESARGARAAVPTSRPLPAAGRLRRLRFEKLWEKHQLGGDEAGTLLRGTRGPVFSSGEMACGFTSRGELLFRRVATHGVAVSAQGDSVCAEADRLLGFAGQASGARWLRDHDGRGVGPLLLRQGNAWVGLLESRAAFAVSAVTGRELWRSTPPRTQRCFVSLQGHRVLLTTDSGSLFGIDLDDGQVRYRLRTGFPYLGPAVAWGRKTVAALGRGGRLGLVVADAHSGTVHWTREYWLARPSAPLPQGSRLMIAGEHEGQGTLFSLGARGRTVWQRSLHLGEGPYALFPVGRHTLVSSRSGAATLLSSTGEVQWHIGACGDPLPHPVNPLLARSVLILPGERVRAVEPKSGQVMAEIQTGPTLCDLKTDARLNLYLLDELGTLSAYRLSTHLAVVDRP